MLHRVELLRSYTCLQAGLRVAITMLAAAGNLARAVAADDGPGPGLRDDWKWMVTIPERMRGETTIARESRIRLSNDMGWLVVRRSTADGDLEWQVVLARASDPKRPEIEIEKPSGVLRIRYREYFIREAVHGSLRIYRERKTETSPRWPACEIEGDRRDLGSDDGFEKTRVASWAHDSWCWIECGPVQGPPDLLVRLQPTTQRKGRASRGNGINGIHSSKGGPIEMFYGDCSLQDEGDLFVGNRMRFEEADSGLVDFDLRDRLPGGELPAIAAQQVFNATKPPTMDDLKGNPAIVAFWSSSPAAGATQLARLEQIHRKFGPRGLAVIGIHAVDNSESLQRVLRDNQITFPVLLDSGVKTDRELVGGDNARRFKVDFLPCFFLVDGTGKVVWGYAMAPPTDERISTLLKP